MNKNSSEYKNKLSRLIENLNGGFIIENSNPYGMDDIVNTEEEFKLVPLHMASIKSENEDNRKRYYICKDRVSLKITGDKIIPQINGFKVVGAIKWALLQYIIKDCEFNFEGYSGPFKLYRGKLNSKNYTVGFSNTGGSFMQKYDPFKGYWARLVQEKKNSDIHRKFYKKEEGYHGENPYASNEYSEAICEEMVEYLEQYGYKVERPQ